MHRGIGHPSLSSDISPGYLPLSTPDISPWHLPPSPQTSDLGTYSLLLTSSDDHWRYVQTCSPEDLPFPHTSTDIGWPPGGRYASYWNAVLFALFPWFCFQMRTNRLLKYCKNSQWSSPYEWAEWAGCGWMKWLLSRSPEFNDAGYGWGHWAFVGDTFWWLKN